MMEFYDFLVNNLTKKASTMTIERAISVWNEFCPDLSYSRRWRDLFIELERLRDAKKIVWSRKKSSYKDYLFPRTISFPNIMKKNDYSWARDYSWNSALVPYVKKISSINLNDAKIISQWLDNNSITELLPLRLRSWEIFKDEKHMDNWKDGLFGQARIPLEIIGAFYPCAPIIWERGNCPNGLLMVLENYHSYQNFINYNERNDRWAGVVYGNGYAIKNMTDSVLDAAKKCEADGIEYFGDIDPAGIIIMNDFFGNLEGKLPCQAFEEGYERILTGEGNSLSKTDHTYNVELALQKWLPRQKERILELWKKKLRVPQEAFRFK